MYTLEIGTVRSGGQALPDSVHRTPWTLQSMGELGATPHSTADVDEHIAGPEEASTSSRERYVCVLLCFVSLRYVYVEYV